MSPRAWLQLAGLSGLLIVLALVVPGWTQTARGKKYALLVGVRSYDHSRLTDLKYTENDVEELGKFLTTAGYEVVLLTTTRGDRTKSARPTRANIEKELDRLLDKVTKHDVVLIGLAGHGLLYQVKIGGREREESFFCPCDAKPIDTNDYSKVAKTMLPFRELFSKLDESGAGSRLLLIDACRDEAGGSRSAKIESVPRPSRGTAALFACKSGERAYETNKLGKGHGIFFYRVLQGLKKEARNRKGQVTWSQLATYVQESVPDDVETIIRGGARQTPHLMANLEGDPVLLQAGKEKVVKTKESKPITNSLGMKLVLIPAGKFKMGSLSDEKGRDSEDEQQHEVEISKAFYLGMHEVTQKQFKQVMGYNPSYFSSDGKRRPGTARSDYDGNNQPGGGKSKVQRLDTDDFPVENVSWHEAVEFCAKLSVREKALGRTYRLPAEAEWEYACRGPAVSLPYHFGGTISSAWANFGAVNTKEALGRTSPVGRYPDKANAFGLCDMHGNVAEWCSDWYVEGYYKDSPRRDPAGPARGKSRVFRGGCWHALAANCRSAARDNQRPDHRDCHIGFRVALGLPAR